jgi:hypothetical protein
VAKEMEGLFESNRVVGPFAKKVTLGRRTPKFHIERRALYNNPYSLDESLPKGNLLRWLIHHQW